MPRHYQRRGIRALWSPNDLKLAIAAVKNGTAVRKAAKMFNIPRSTLQLRLKQDKDGVSSLGRSPVFSTAQENELRDRVIYLSKIFLGITREEVKKCAYKYAQQHCDRNPFNKHKEMAGNDWLYGFLRRNPAISLRAPEPTSINRLTAFNEEEVSLFFRNLETVLTKHKFAPHMIFNLDETGISTVQSPSKILAQKGSKQVGFITSWERGKNITLVCAFSAVGFYVPPMFIFPRKRMNPLLEKGGPTGAVYWCSDNGWITEDLFVKYLQHFNSYVKASPEEPVLLIMDNHTTHCTLQVYEFCKAIGIVILTIPPHSSHRLQPLDKTFFSSLKNAYNDECNKFLKSHPYQKITPFDVAELVNKAFIRIATPEKAINGFKSTGIWPYNPDIFSPEDFLPANSHQIQTEDIADIEVRRHQSPEPSETSPSLSFTELLPSPSPKGSSTRGKQRKTTRKQHSQIITSTPNKSSLEEKEMKKQKRIQTSKQVIPKRKLFQTDKDKVEQPTRVKRARKMKNKNYDDTNSDEYDDEDRDPGVAVDDLCLVCGEFGKNGEIWLRCVICGNWAHKACANIENKTFVCDYCN